MKLPELPPSNPRSFGYGGYEMLKYGRACADAALETAAQVCDVMQSSDHHPLVTLQASAHLIRALKEKAAPPRTERKPLTEDEIAAIGKRMLGIQFGNTDVDFARAIERAHGIGEPE